MLTLPLGNPLRWIFGLLDIKEDDRVLDLGCGFAKLWRNNWTDIPKGTKVTGYDIHGSWADDFAKVESVLLPNYWHYAEADEVVQKMKDYYEGSEKTIARYEDKLRAYFQEKIDKDGEVVFETESQFWHCYKK